MNDSRGLNYSSCISPTMTPNHELNLHFTPHFFVSLAERMFAQPVTQLWETSHVWSSTESERGSLFSINIGFNTEVQSVAHSVRSLWRHLCVRVFADLLISAYFQGLLSSWLEDWMMSTTSSITAMRSRQSEFIDIIWLRSCVVQALCKL